MRTHYTHEVIEPGTRFGKLTVIRECSPLYDSHFKKYIYRYECKCDCGKTLIIRKSNLKHQVGCRSCSAIIHGDNKGGGKKRTRLYRIWLNMCNRCRNPKYIDHHLYFDRHISVCDEWLNYSNFKDWALSNGYTDSLSIDRIDNTKGYSPENCRWANAYTQRNNQRGTVVYLEYKGRVYPRGELCRITGTNWHTLYGRMKNGYSVEEAVELKPWERRKNTKTPLTD